MIAEQFYLILVILLTLTNWFFVFLLCKLINKNYKTNVKLLASMKREQYWLSLVSNLMVQDADKNDGIVRNPLLVKEIERLQMINAFGIKEYFEKYDV